MVVRLIKKRKFIMEKIIKTYFEIASVVGKILATIILLPAMYFTMHFAVWLNNYMVYSIV